MDLHTRTNFEEVVALLKEAAGSIRKLEEEARAALLSQDDQITYRSKLEAKARVLMDLPARVSRRLLDLPVEAQAEIQAGLVDFAGRAGQAVRLASVFYMAALLYPDDYQEGEANDLETFIEEIQYRFRPRF
jgi:hypothetical protein